ncbi:spore germination protein [Paenibacillus sp. MMS20-IR301]|uniref:spore germination protein n=1 Tax=Paenibacillus sp. MMS20-IR301 TaxID=2895946 RepID=UPI0028E8646C|nr:spore germination protein [Paenibacillus sp. MMS20-IR301]WNS44415.1 spore germination protein [Paenibacillus sp. MMS20-IR301]
MAKRTTESDQAAKQPEPSVQADSSGTGPDNPPISPVLEENLDQIRTRLGNSPDLIFRTYELINRTVRVAAVYMIGITDREIVDVFISHAMSFESLNDDERLAQTPEAVFAYIKENALSIGKEKLVQDINGLLEALLSGDTIILVNGLNEAVSGSTCGGEVRPVSEAVTQVAIRGSKESFTETISTNIALVRKIIKNPDLWTETMKLGDITHTDITIMYIRGIADEETIKVFKQKLKEIQVDSVLESGYIEQIIEDNKYSPFPTLYNTERPDSVAGNLLDGRIAIFVDGTPFVLIAPTTFFMFFHTVEDYYQRYDISTLIRLLRFLCLLISLYGPAIFVAALNFHQEMIPTPLLINLASQREGVPFPAFVEAILMEVTFEIIREAGVRMPSPIGQTVSIIGGLVLGTAAVQAGIVSPAMVIVVSLTGISSFATPAFNMALSIRMLRFVIMVIAAFMGLYGIAIFTIMLIAHMCSLRSLGVPYMSPMGPFVPENQKDTFIRSPVHFMKTRSRLKRNNKPGSDSGKSGTKRKAYGR